MYTQFFDLGVELFLKAYYWPYFILGNLDTFTDIVLGKNICKST